MQIITTTSNTQQLYQPLADLVALSVQAGVQLVGERVRVPFANYAVSYNALNTAVEEGFSEGRGIKLYFIRT